MFCNRQRQIRLLSINTNVLSNFLLRWIPTLSPCRIQRIPRGFKIYCSGTNNLVFVHQREHHVYFLQASVVSVGIRALTYPGLMANQGDGDHHNNNNGNDIDNTVLTRAKFLEFRKEARDENQQFLEKSPQIIGKIE